MTNKNIDNKTLIVGGSSSLGKITCKEFTKNGCHVITTYTNNVITSQPLLDVYHLDLRSNASITDFVFKINNNKVTIKNLIFLSSILPGNNLKNYKEDDFNEVMQINFIGQIKLIKHFMKIIKNNTNIIMVSSISGRKGSFDPIYAASKGAIISFVKSMVNQIPVGARINAIAPSLIEDSKMFFDMKKERRDYHLSASPSGELLKLEDLSKILFDLCQSHWRHINGACIDVNGGVYV